MKRHFYLLLFLFSSISLFSQTPRIIVDELVDDWKSVSTSFADGLDNPGGIDFINMKVSNDENYLYVNFTINRELCLGNTLVDHEIWLSIDADNNPSTGYPEQTGYGTELAINMNGHYAWFNIPNPSTRVTFGDIGLITAPTITASSFELAIPRDIKPNGSQKLFNGDSIRIVLNEEIDKDRMPDDGQVFTYVFSKNYPPKSQSIGLEKIASNDIRVVSHNLLFNNGFSSSALREMERVVSAIDGDIYCFQECTEDTTNIRNYFNSWLPLQNGEGWKVGKGGNRVIVSRWPISQHWSLNRKTAHLIDVPDSSLEGSFLVINGHLSCCTNNSGRQEQVDELASFILDAKQPGGLVTLEDSTPIVFLGDMNFVGFNQQYKTVITGAIQDSISYGQGGFLDWDDTELSDARPLHIDSNFVHTWRDLQGDGFPPGRLDYQFYTDAVLTQKNSFVLDTERMSDSMLIAYNLKRSDTRVVADHLPVVVDYSGENAPNTTSLQGFNTNKAYLRVFPNPCKGYLNIESDAGIEGVVLYDLLGNEVFQTSGPDSRISLPQLTAGMYLAHIKLTNNQVQHVRVIVAASGH